MYHMLLNAPDVECRITLNVGNLERQGAHLKGTSFKALLPATRVYFR